MNIFSKKQALNTKQLLTKIKDLKKEKTLLKSLLKEEKYYDEPFFYHYSSWIGNPSKKYTNKGVGVGTGFSFSETQAKIKSVCEAIERYCLYRPPYRIFLKTSYNTLKEKAIDINDITSFSTTQMEDSPELIWDEDTHVNWVKGFHALSGKEVFLPAQMVYLYDLTQLKEKKKITARISSGSASATTLTDALITGILEILERDAFMIHYLNNTCGEVIDISNNSKLRSLTQYLKKYRLEFSLINLPTDFPIFTFLTLITDSTGVGPYVSAGMKCGFDPQKVAIRSIEEACQTRGWIRSVMQNTKDLSSKKFSKEDLDLQENRGLFWAFLKMKKYLEPWIHNKRQVQFKQLQKIQKDSSKKKLQYLLDMLESRGHKVYFVDITSKKVKKKGFIVVKVVIPSLQPLHLEESSACFGGKRLYTVPVELGYLKQPLQEKEFNKVPHFFL